MHRYRATLLLVLCGICVGGRIVGAAERGDVSSLTNEYLAARDQVIEDLGKLSQDAAWDREPKALADLEERMNSLIGPISIRALPKASFNLNDLTHGEGFGKLDGLRFASEDGRTQLVVSTLPLLRSWLALHANWGENLSPDFPRVLGTEPFYTQAIAEGAAYFIFADLPVSAPSGTSFVSATLDAEAQDVGQREPTEIVMSVLAGDRVYILTQKLDTRTAAIPACETIASALLRKSEELSARYRASNLADQKSLDEAERLELKSDEDYRHCFAARARNQEGFAGALRQAQALLAVIPSP